MKKKVVVLGGGTGMSTLLRGLKQFPLDITAIVSVCDDGKSTGRLRKEFNLPAVGDIRKVIVALSETEPLIEKILEYRFNTTSDLDGHTVGNLLLTATSNVTGNMSDGIESLGKILNLKGKVLPLTEDNVTLVAKMQDGSIVEGEHNITEYHGIINKVYYKKQAIATKEALKAINEADLIILSMGSLYTSIIPNLICNDIIDAIDASNAKVLYACNIMTQPGETDNFKVSDHIRILNKYLGQHKIDLVIANDGNIKQEIIDKYATLEQKDMVICDIIETNKLCKLIHQDLISIDNNLIRHNVLKLAFIIFEYLLNN